MEHDDLDFNDPGLKGAIQRAWGQDRAPQQLRGRIGHLVATAGSMDQVIDASDPSVWQRWQGRVYGLAAAAVIVLGVGLLVLYYQGTFDSAFGGYAGNHVQPVVMPSKTPVPVTLAQSMVASHDACGKLHDHRLIRDLPANNYSTLTLKLTADLGFPVIARSIGSDWTFKGAGECAVGELRGSHLMFARGDQTVSVFSLPTSCMSGVAPGAKFEGMAGNHPVAGFARGGAVYGVVGSSPSGTLTVDALAALRDGLFVQFDIGCGGEPSDLDFDF